MSPRFYVAEKGGFELPGVSPPVDSNTLKTLIFKPFYFSGPVAVHRKKYKSHTKSHTSAEASKRANVRLMISAAFSISPLTWCLYTPNVSILSE